MVVVTRMSVSDSDDGSCSEDLDRSSRGERDATEESEASAMRLKKLRQRERMKKLHRGLMALRSMVPTGRGFLAEDTAAYVQQLRAETQIVQAEIHREEARLQQILLSNKPAENAVKVEMNDSGLIIEVECEKRPGLVLALSRLIDGLDLTIIQVTMRSQDRISLYIQREGCERCGCGSRACEDTPAAGYKLQSVHGGLRGIQGFAAFGPTKIKLMSTDKKMQTMSGLQSAVQERINVTSRFPIWCAWNSGLFCFVLDE